MLHSTVFSRVNLDVKVIEAATGRAIAEWTQHNLVVNAGLNLVRDLLNGDAVNGITHFAIGTDGTAPTATDTALGTEIFRDVTTQKTKLSLSLRVKYFLSTTDANGNTLREVGLLNAAAAGDLYARVALSVPIVKTSAIAVTFTWTLSWAV